MTDKWQGEWDPVMYNVYRLDKNSELGSLRFCDRANLTVNLTTLMKCLLTIAVTRRDPQYPVQTNSLGFLYNSINLDPIVCVSVTLPQKSTLLHFSDITGTWQNKMYVKSSYYTSESMNNITIKRWYVGYSENGILLSIHKMFR